MSHSTEHDSRSPGHDDGEAKNTGPVEDIVERVASVSHGETLAVEDVLSAFGEKSFLPIMMVPALLVVSPMSGIPFFSSLCGIAIVFISAQMVAKRNHLWLPGFITHRCVPADKARGALDKMARVARWLDRKANGHLSALVHTPVRQIIPILCLICGALMPVLEIIPFSSSVLGLAVVLLATGLLTRDGLFVLLGVTVMAFAMVIPFFAASQIGSMLSG